MLITLKTGAAIDPNYVRSVHVHQDDTGFKVLVNVTMSDTWTQTHLVPFDVREDAVNYRDELIGHINAAQADSRAAWRAELDAHNAAAFVEFQRGTLDRFAVFMDSMIAKVVNEKGPTS